jgi:hypothetical protein
MTPLASAGAVIATIENRTRDILIAVPPEIESPTPESAEVFSISQVTFVLKAARHDLVTF